MPEPTTDERDRYRRLFDEAPEPYLLTDLDGVITLANVRAARLLGAAVDGLVATSLSDHVHDDDRDELREILQRVGAGHRVSGWEVRLSTEGSRVRTLVSVEPTVRDTGELHWVLSDARPLDLVRDRLHRLVEDSMDDVAALRSVTAWQASLLGCVAQDMRPPLQVISSTIDSLLDGLADDAAGLDGPAVRAMLERASSQAKKLHGLLPTLLQLGRTQLEEPTSHRQVVRLRPLVDEALHELAPIGHGVVYDLRVERLETDPLQLARVVVELVTHAVDHGPEDVDLVLGAVPRGVDVELFLDVPGYELDASNSAELFSPFGGSHEEGGEGLGLLLVTVFAQMHGGRAWVEQRNDDGASFRVLLSNALPDRHDDDVP